MNFYDKIVGLALFEDSGSGDLTGESIMLDRFTGNGIIVAEESFTLAGIGVVKKVFETLDPQCSFYAPFSDGDYIQDGEIIFKITANLLSLLKGERVALNFLQHLSGIATRTRAYVDELEFENVILTDTRKTTPGLRVLEKSAVRAGGARNHRMSLYDGIVIKADHITVAGSLVSAVNAVRQRVPNLIKIEVEVSSMDEVEDAVYAGVPVIRLKNMEIDLMTEAVKYVNKRAVVEASGNVTLEMLNKIAATGVDVISCGDFIQQARAAAMSMQIDLTD